MYAEGSRCAKMQDWGGTRSILAGMKVFLGRCLCPPLGYQSFEIIEPKKLKSPQESHADLLSSYKLGLNPGTS